MKNYEAALELIKGRRSIRAYTEESVSQEQIAGIIEAGRYAPSAKNLQPWRFIVITDRDAIASLSGGVKRTIRKILCAKPVLGLFSPSLRNPIYNNHLSKVANSDKDLVFFDAPLLIFVTSTKGMFNDVSCACCAENMMLAAHAMGLGSCWIGYARFLEYGRGFYRKIGVPRGQHVVAAIAFGHPVKVPKNALPRKEEAGVINRIGENGK